MEEDLSYAKLFVKNRIFKLTTNRAKGFGTELNFDDIVKLVNELPSSKRSILRIIAKVFHPLGMLTLFSLR